MPNPAARDPHTPLFDQKGTLWFTVQNGNFVGSLDPATGKVTLKQTDTPKAMPHGLAINSKGIPFFALLGSNKIGSIDPRTMEVTEHVLPEGTWPRRLAITGDDIVWYADIAGGCSVDWIQPPIRPGEFPSPAGAKSVPWSIAATPDGMIWFTRLTSSRTPSFVSIQRPGRCGRGRFPQVAAWSGRWWQRRMARCGWRVAASARSVECK